ncbi:hypothetical protein [Paenibacillus daejeonensis]|uniref:hypothetical protein n=1 Tax=Paenibacillus daejeonensis TaxID=135193 RepID=UPI00036EF28A|nr:hypothetical protein [Paenibacillus daejeonensis]
MLKSILAAMMIIGLSTISPTAQGPTSNHEHFSYTYPPLAAGKAEIGGSIGTHPGVPAETTQELAGLLPAHIQKPIGAAVPGTETVHVPESLNHDVPVVTEHNEVESVEHEPAEQEPALELGYRQVNGLDLDADADTVLQLLGDPEERTTDPLLGTEEYHYAAQTVGLYEDLVDYIIVPASAGQVQLGNVTIPLDMEQLKQHLGEPDYTAEDGLVYVQQEVCLKLFYGENEAELDSVQIYWLSHI